VPLLAKCLNARACGAQKARELDRGLFRQQLLPLRLGGALRRRELRRGCAVELVRQGRAQGKARRG
jgi:hypothetical protein